MKNILLYIALLLGTTQLMAQNVLKVPDASGYSLSTAEVDEIADISATINTYFEPGKEFQVIDAAIYNYNDEMSEAQVEASFDIIKARAKAMSANHLLMTRVHSSMRNDEYELKIHLEIGDLMDISCVASFPQDMNIYMENHQIIINELQEWYEYLQDEYNLSSYDHYYKVVDLVEVKLKKICCGSLANRSSSCAIDEIDPNLLGPQQDKKFFILGELRNALFNKDGTLRNTSIEIDSVHDLFDFDFDQFGENKTSRVYFNEHVLGFSDIELAVHIYTVDNGIKSDDNYILSNPDTSHTKKNVYGPKTNGARGFIGEQEFVEYNFGKFAVTIKADYDLIEILQKVQLIFDEHFISQKSIADFMQSGIPFIGMVDRLFENYRNLRVLNHITDQDLMDLSDENKMFIMWRLGDERFNHKFYPRLLYKMFLDFHENHESKFFFEYYDTTPSFYINLLNFDYGDIATTNAIYELFTVYYQLAFLKVANENLELDFNFTVDSIPSFGTEIKSLGGFKFLNILSEARGRSITLKERYITHYVENPPSPGSFHSAGPQPVYDTRPYLTLPLMHPVMIKSLGYDNFEVKKNFVPLILLHAIKNRTIDNNIWEAIVLAGNIASSAFAVSNLRYFAYLGRIRMFFVSTEIGASFAQLVVSHTNLIEDNNLRKQAQFLLMVIEVSAAIISHPATAAAGNIDIANINAKIISDARIISDDILITALSKSDPVLKSKLIDLSNFFKIVAGREDVLARITKLKLIPDNASINWTHLENYLIGARNANNAIFENINKLTDARIAELANLGTVSTKFCVDVASAIKGTELVNFVNNSFDGFKTWKIPNKHSDALATDVTFLTKLSEDLNANTNLVSYMDDLAGFNAYKTFRSSKTDVLDAVKSLQSQGKLFGKFDLIKNPGCIGHLDPNVEKVLFDAGWAVHAPNTTATVKGFIKETGEVVGQNHNKFIYIEYRNAPSSGLHAFDPTKPAPYWKVFDDGFTNTKLIYRSTISPNWGTNISGITKPIYKNGVKIN